MDNQPLVSIITPAYNQEEFIEGAILSIKNQDYPNVEHIIIDGASTDNTLAVIKKYEGTYNMHWVSEPDNSSIEAVNKGFLKAQGEILAYFGADDSLLPWSASVAVEAFKRHPGIELIYGDMIHFNLDSGAYRLAFFPETDLPSMLRRRGLVPTPAAFFRRSVLEKVGFQDENLPFGGEYDFFIKAFMHCKVSKIEEALAVDTYHRKNTRTLMRQQLREESESIKQKYGAPDGINGYLLKMTDWLRHFAVTRFLIMKFAFYYWTKKRRTSLEDSVTYPWQNLIEFPGFQVTSWLGFLIMMMPWTSMRYNKNWFVLNMMGVNKR